MDRPWYKKWWVIVLFFLFFVFIVGRLTGAEYRGTDTDSFGFIFIIFGLMIYVLPALIAYKKRKKNKGAILLTNLLLGWTMLGWVITLIWAVTND